MVARLSPEVPVTQDADVWMLDDVPERVAFLTELTGVTPRHALNVEAALASGGFRGARVWMLDHDLCAGGDGMPCPSLADPRARGCRCPDGRSFIRSVAYAGEPWPEVVVVHSANVVARAQMIDLLRDAGCPRAELVPVERWTAMLPTLRAIVRPR